MKPTLELVRGVFEGCKPERGSYSSKWEYKDHEDCVQVTLHCDWKPRYMKHCVFVTGVDGKNVTFRNDLGNEPDDNTDTSTLTVEQLAEELANGD